MRVLLTKRYRWCPEVKEQQDGGGSGVALGLNKAEYRPVNG